MKIDTTKQKNYLFFGYTCYICFIQKYGNGVLRKFFHKFLSMIDFVCQDQSIFLYNLSISHTAIRSWVKLLILLFWFGSKRPHQKSSYSQKKKLQITSKFPKRYNIEIWKLKIKQIMKVLNNLNETQKLNWSFCLHFSVTHTYSEKKPANMKKDLIAKDVAIRF